MDSVSFQEVEKVQAMPLGRGVVVADLSEACDWSFQIRGFGRGGMQVSLSGTK